MCRVRECRQQGSREILHLQDVFRYHFPDVELSPTGAPTTNNGAFVSPILVFVRTGHMPLAKHWSQGFMSISESSPGTAAFIEHYKYETGCIAPGASQSRPKNRPRNATIFLCGTSRSKWCILATILFWLIFWPVAFCGCAEQKSTAFLAPGFADKFGDSFSAKENCHKNCRVFGSIFPDFGDSRGPKIVAFFCRSPSGGSP